ncbi:MAG: NCS2 family permease [Planctomycetaceae bacterium]|nr:NCS2 family permease [Planctomycetaceae bacterium]
MKLFVKHDLDGFFGLFVDNLVQLLMIIGLCGGLCGMPPELLYGVVLPGSAISILIGNLFYAWQAHRLAKKTGRDDITALPYGINTPSLLVFVFFVILPEYQTTQDPFAAWRLGLLACLGSGVIELLGSFVGHQIRRSTPRAALLSTLAGIAIGFISMTFALQIFQKPLIAMVPLVIVLLGLFASVRLPLGLPTGFIAVLVGTAVSWLMAAVDGTVPNAPALVTFGKGDPSAVQNSLKLIGWHAPQWCGAEIQQSLQQVKSWLPFLSVVIPMGLFNVIGSMQNVESAEASGDSYSTTTSMAANGLGTILAALFGSCFPTTIYIGHPGWKALGARAGYSSLNGIVIVALALSGLIGLVAAIIPIEAGAAIVLWIGIIITAQAFQSVPEDHGAAVAVGLFPAIAAWGATVMMGTVIASQGDSLKTIVDPPVVVAAEDTKPAPVPAKPTTEVNGFLVHGLLLMERGYIFTCMILAAASACLIDRKFGAASLWLLTAALLTGLGLMHAYQIYETGPVSAFDYIFRFVQPVDGAYVYRADDIAIGYLLSAATVFLIGRSATFQAKHA